MTCPVCGAAESLLQELPDGTTYCTVHRGLVGTAEGISTPTQVVDQPVPVVDVPEVVLPPVELPPHLQPHEAAPDPQELTAPASEEGGDVAAVPSPPSEPLAPVVDIGTDYEPDDEGGPNLPALKLMIGLCLQAGLMSLDDKNNPLEPPTGWAPPGCDAVPEFAAACALASALLIRTFGIDHLDVRALIKPFLDTDTGDE